jgi:DICT domain-containing protein
LPPAGAIDPDLDSTIHAGLRRRHPDLPAHTLTRRAMLALSHAIEDEALAQSDRATITGAFQRVDAYRQALPRWRELARSADSTLVFADFSRSGVVRGVHQVAIPERAPLTREWSVVCDAPRSAAVLAGWERADGRFEVVWTVEPELVREATELGRHLASTYAPRLSLPEAPLASPDPAATARRATAVTNRAIAYLDG